MRLPTIPTAIRPGDRIQALVAQAYGVSEAALKGVRGPAEIMDARHVAMYLTRIVTRRSLPQIARDFGGRHHTTVLDAVDRIEKTRCEWPEFDQFVRKLEAEIRQ